MLVHTRSIIYGSLLEHVSGNLNPSRAKELKTDNNLPTDGLKRTG